MADDKPEKNQSPNGAPQTTATPAAVELSGASDKLAEADSGKADPNNIHDLTPNKPLTPKRTIHLSARATIFGVIIVLFIIAANVAAIYFILKSRNQKAVTPTGYNPESLSVEEINKLNSKTATIGESFGTLIIAPFTQFKNKIQVDKDASIGGKLNVVSATTLAGLTAGSTSLSELNVAGNSTLNATSVKSTLAVAGAVSIQGAVTMSSALTVGGSLNVLNNASIAGSLTVNTINFKNATLNGPLAINGHYISGGPGPSLSYNTNTLGTSGTSSVSGNDTTGTIVITPGNDSGVGATCTPVVGVDPNTCGLLATVTFGAGYSKIPRINLTPVGREAGQMQYYITRTSAGFKLYTANKIVGASVSVPNPQIGFDYFIAE